MEKTTIKTLNFHDKEIILAEEVEVDTHQKSIPLLLDVIEQLNHIIIKYKGENECAHIQRDLYSTMATC